jgi:hypothetical protein
LQDIWKIILTAVLTAGASNYFSYWKDKKIAAGKYAEDSLRKLYIPIYKILVKHIYPGDGYDGIDEDQVSDIKKIIDENPELTDPELGRIVDSTFEDVMHQNSRPYDDQLDLKAMRYDDDRELLDYVLIAFNKTRKNLGLPSNKYYTSKIYTSKTYKFYQKLEYKIRHIIIDSRINREYKRKFKRKK